MEELEEIDENIAKLFAIEVIKTIGLINEAVETAIDIVDAAPSISDINIDGLNIVFEDREGYTADLSGDYYVMYDVRVYYDDKELGDFALSTDKYELNFED